MSVIKLVAMTGFRVTPSGKPEVVFGADGVRFDEERKQWVFKIASVPMESPIDLPQSGLSLLYGFRETISEVAAWKRKTENEGLEFHTAYINVEVGEIFRQIVGRNDIAGLRFASVRRIKADLQQEIMDSFSGLLERETRDLKAVSRIREIASCPDLLDKVLYQPPFDGLEVFVYPVKDGEMIRYLAFVKPQAHIVSIEQNEQMPWRFEL